MSFSSLHKSERLSNTNHVTLKDLHWPLFDATLAAKARQSIILLFPTICVDNQQTSVDLMGESPLILSITRPRDVTFEVH